MNAHGSSLVVQPFPGSIWSGRGSTFIVYDLWEEDARVYRITGRNGLVKTPRARSFVPLKFFHDGTFTQRDLERDDIWTKAIAERYAYRPPTIQDDERVCGRCRRHWGSRLVTPRADHFSVFNWLTGKYHSSSGYGVTDCGRDATGDEWLWPI